MKYVHSKSVRGGFGVVLIERPYCVTVAVCLSPIRAGPCHQDGNTVRKEDKSRCGRRIDGGRKRSDELLEWHSEIQSARDLDFDPKFATCDPAPYSVVGFRGRLGSCSLIDTRNKVFFIVEC